MVQSICGLRHVETLTELGGLLFGNVLSNFEHFLAVDTRHQNWSERSCVRSQVIFGLILLCVYVSDFLVSTKFEILFVSAGLPSCKCGQTTSILSYFPVLAFALSCHLLLDFVNVQSWDSTFGQNTRRNLMLLHLTVANLVLEGLERFISHGNSGSGITLALVGGSLAQL